MAKKEKEAPAEKIDKADKVKKNSDSRERQLSGINIVGKIVGVLVVTWLISVSYFAFVFFAIGMLPTIMTMLIDRGAGRFASKTVSACNFIGIVPYIFNIAIAYDKDIAARHLISDMSAWVYIYSSAIIGLLMIWIIPQITLIIFSFRADYKIANLRAEQEELLEEWGEELQAKKKK